MKVMVCANLLIGDPGVLGMPSQLMTRWHQDKIEALAEVLEAAIGRGAETCIMAGGLFAEGFIPQSLFEEAIEELGSHEITVTWLPFERESADLDTRISIPDNVNIVRGLAGEVYEGIRIVHNGTEVELVTNTSEGASLRSLDPMEPMGFGEQAKSNFLMLDISEGNVDRIEEVPHALHPFVSKVANMSGKETSKEMLAEIQNAIEGIEEKSCLHLALRGATSLSAYINTKELEQVLGKRFFYVEVSNECTVDLDEGELANDVSLLAEFVRMVDSDDSLSQTEKSRIMRCGWNSLNGKELAE